MDKNIYQAKRIALNGFAHMARYLILLAFGYVLLHPFIYIIVGAVKGASDFYDPTVTWIPKHFSLKNFSEAISVLDFWRSLGSTMVYEIVSALLQFCTCTITAYGLARFTFKGKSVLMGAMLISIFIPVTMTIIPTYINFRYLDFLGVLGLISKAIGHDIRPSVLDTPLVFYLPSALGVGLKGGLFTYIFTQFFKGLPKELEEAAWIDGASPWKTFLCIIMPSSETASVTVLLFSVIWHWNDFYLSQMFLSGNYPLSVNLNNIFSALNRFSEGKINVPSVILASCFLFIIPILIFYMIIQKKFVKSIATSGIVG